MTTWTATDDDSDLRCAAAHTLQCRTLEIVALLSAELDTVDGVAGTTELAEAFGRWAGYGLQTLTAPAARELAHRPAEVMDRVHSGVRLLALQRCYPRIVCAMMLRALRDFQRAVDAYLVTCFLVDAG